MSNTDEKTLLLLSKQIYLCTNVNITPDNLNLLKFNTATTNTVEDFWSVLNILSRYTVKKNNFTIDFDFYDKVTSTKLYFGYLNYSDIGFFSLPRNNVENTVSLVIAFFWLLVRYNVLTLLIEDKIINQFYDNENINENNHPAQKEENDRIPNTQLTSHLIREFHVIIKKIMQMNYNLKDIIELMNEKCNSLIKLSREIFIILKRHHLGLSELNLIKNYYTNNHKFCEADLQYIRRLNNAANMIIFYEKWNNNHDILTNWMTNIIKECRSNRTIAINDDELSKFISTVRYLNKSKISSIKTSKIINNGIFTNSVSSDSSRDYETELCTEKWNHKVIHELTKTEIEILQKKRKIESSINIIIKSVPYCIQL